MPDKKRIRKSFRAVEGDWRRVDIHLHTPASADWLEPGTTYLEWLQKAASRGLDIVAITDHNTVEGVARLRAEIERLTWLEANDRLRPQERRELDEFRRLGDKILVLPGFEFTATFGFHILAIFPPETPLRKLELLLLRLGVPMERLIEGSTEVGPTTDVLTAYRLIHEAGGLVIAAHANSTHGVALQGMSFGGQTRIAFTQDVNLHALEVNDLESTSRRATARFFDGSKPEYPRRMHCIQGSDAHRLSRDPRDKNRLGVGERVTEMLLPEVSFEALRSLLEGGDFTRTRPYRPPAEAPFDHVEAAREQGPNIVQAFHESLSREGGRLHKVLCDVVAFANTRGGTIYVGVSATRKTPPKGVENADLTVAMLRKEMERDIAPPIEPNVDTLQSQGVPVIRITVADGPDKPYALNQTRIYVRQEGETNEAVRDEIVQLVLSGQRLAMVETEIEEEPAPAATFVQPGAPSLDVALPARPVDTPSMLVLPAEPVAQAQASSDALPPPAIGVEIVAMEERKGNRYFTIRDLRNGNTIQNVTLHSARKLWSYAINQYLTSPVDATRIQWDGDLGVVQVARRAKRLRYDLAIRLPDDRIRVFYGVTADGMTGPWSRFLQAEDRNGDAVHEAGADVESDMELEAQVLLPIEFAPVETLPVYTDDDLVSPSLVESPEPVGEQESKPKHRTRRSRSRKAQPEPIPVPYEDRAAASANAIEQDATGEAAFTDATAEGVVVTDTASAPERRSPALPAEAVALLAPPQAEVAPAEDIAQIAPPKRTRRSASKAKSEATPAPVPSAPPSAAVPAVGVSQPLVPIPAEVDASGDGPMPQIDPLLDEEMISKPKPGRRTRTRKPAVDVPPDAELAP